MRSILEEYKLSQQVQAISLTKNILHLFVKIGFFHGINVALKRGEIDSELFGLRITECNLRNGKKSFENKAERPAVTITEVSLHSSRVFTFC